MKDFWLSCGHHLLDRSAGGGLEVTDEFLKAYLARPELAPPPDACMVERTMHAALLAEPRRAVSSEEIASIADTDARENWQLMIEFRDHLLRYPTLEAAYVALVSKGISTTPPLFLNQLVHVILRNALDGCTDAYILRAAELFFRPQRITLHEGALLAADEEKIAGSNPTPLSPLVSMLGLEKSTAIDVLNDDNLGGYWDRSDRFDLALDLTPGRRGQGALGEAIGCWIGHLLAVAVDVQPLVEMRDVAFTWYVGLDAEGTKIGDALWNGEDLDETARARVLGLYRLQFRAADEAQNTLADEPVYLILAMTPDNVLRLKPQNLVAGLPARHPETAS
jgi:hypothetical protein